MTAAELATAAAALDTELAGGVVEGVGLLHDRDDLLLFVRVGEERRALQVAPGGARARVTITTRRFAKDAFATGPRHHRLEQLLVGARFERIATAAGERRATLLLRDAGEAPVRIEIELFGNRGLWAVCAGDGTIAALSRLPNVKGRELRPGAAYAPPAPRPHAESQPERFAAPVLAAIDLHFTALDLEAERDGDRTAMARALERHAKRLDQRIAGLVTQREAMERADELRLHADLLLAYSHGLAADAPALHAPDPRDPDCEIVIPRDPGVPAHVQASALYKRARKAEHGIGICGRQLGEARADRERIAALAASIETATDDQLPRLRRELEAAGLVPRERPAPADAATKKLAKVTRGENFRRFTSAEGQLILVGRDNRQNDRLTTRVARGNDVWMHVGRGYAGSHVVVRVPKGKTASLETLLDAGTLAVHFSKVRGAELEEVVYTQAKHVRKPKGLPPGRVVPAQTKTLRVRRDPERLERLLGSADGDAR